MVTEPKPPIEWPRRLNAPFGAKLELRRGGSASGWRDAEHRVRVGWSARPGRSSQLKTASRSPAATSREPRPADADTTRGMPGPSAARSASAAFSSRVSGLADAAGSSVRSTTATARAPARALASSPCGEGTEAGNADRAGAHAGGAQVVDDVESGVGDGAHGHDDEFGVFGAVALDQAVARGR